MPVPSSISDLSTIPASNSPQGTESAKGTIDDYLRTAFAFIAQLAALAGGPTASLASAATVAIGFAATSNINITGTTTISAFDNWQEGAMRMVTFSGALQLTHNASSLILPGAANITTAAGDAALFKSLGGGNWKCLWYVRAAGTGPVSANGTRDGYLTAADWTAFNNKQAALGFTPYNATNPSGYQTAAQVAGAILSALSGYQPALGFTPYNATNPAGFITADALTNLLSKSGGTMSGPLVLAEGSQAAPSLTFANDGGNDTGFYHIGDGQIGVVCNGVLVARFSTSGFSAINVSQSQ